MFKRFDTYLPDLKESWVLVFFLVVGGSILSGAITLFIGYLFPGLSGWLEVITYPLIFIPPYLWMIRPYKSRVIESEPVPVNNPNFGMLGATLSFILIFPLVFAFNMVIEPLTIWMDTPDFMKELLNQVSANKTSSLFMLVFFAPVLEELFCRGIILRGLLKHLSPVKAILWSAAIFGVIHLNPWQAIPAFLIGVLMGWIYWKTRSLWTTIFIHFINNGFAYIVTIFFPELPENAGYHDMIPGVYYYIFYLVALAYTAGTLLIMNKYYEKSVSNKILPNT
ncbi:MAG: type II CAAX endopeptidase family protein [Bacteroidales bacterium]